MNLRWRLILIASLFLVFSVGLFYVGWYRPTISTSTARVKIDASETARLATDGTDLKILTNTYSTSRNFIFLDNTGDTVSTLTVANLNIEPPYYRIVKGHAHDWLVVTRIESDGTGMINRVDEWYILSWFGNMKMVLSYPSQGNEIPGSDFKNRYWSTDISNDPYPDDSAVDVKTTDKVCSTTEDGGDKACSESSHTDHYVWDTDNEKLVLKILKK